MPDSELPVMPYGGQAPRQQHSETSIAAAEQIVPSLGNLQAITLKYIHEEGPATDEELQVALKLVDNTQRPRRVELTLYGKLIDSGERKVCRSGREGTIWRETTPEEEEAQLVIWREARGKAMRLRLKYRKEIIEKAIKVL